MIADRLRGLAEWADMLARWNASDDPDACEAIVRAVGDDTAAVVGLALLDAALGLGKVLTLLGEGNAPFGSAGAPWCALRTFALHGHAARVVRLSRADFLRVALAADAARLLAPGGEPEALGRNAPDRA